jgi:cation:H+ antiporter
VGTYLPVVGKEITEIMNWSSSFVGVIFLAFVTSFPELIVSIAAARIGAIDMVLGNIAGSNMFNIAILFMIDLFYVKDVIMARASGIYVAIGITLMMMNFIVIFAIIRQSRLKIFNLFSVNALALALLYILSLIISF